MLSGSVPFQTGQQSVFVTLVPIDDDEPEWTETVILRVEETGWNYRIWTGSLEAKEEIVDNNLGIDGLPAVLRVDVEDENELYPVELAFPQEVKAGATVTLSGPSHLVRVWEHPDRTGEEFIKIDRDSYTWTIGQETPPQTVYVEAIAGSLWLKDVVLTLLATDAAATAAPTHSTSTQDSVEATNVIVNLQIFKPGVIDGAESMIDEKDELTTGSATFVNLDNDDQDGHFDDTDDVVTGGDDELVKVRLHLTAPGITDKMKLVATAGGDDIKVWKQNDKAASSAYTLGDEITIPGAGFLDLWVEGISPQTSQRETKLKGEAVIEGETLFDEVALTVIGIDKVEWVGYDNAIDDSNDLDADPNWPTGLAPGAKRVFPDARVMDNPVLGWVQDPDPRSIVRIKTTLSVAPPIPVRVYLRVFDVDDPSADASPVDNEANANDNRGTVFGWQASGVTPNTEVTKELSFAPGDTFKQADYIVTLQPGDNFRVVANADNDFLLRLNNNDDELNVGGAGANANKQRIVNQDIPLTAAPADREVRQADKYCSEVLTVWRFLHVERDSMASIPPGMNEVSGTINDFVGTGTAMTEVITATTFRDGSRDLDLAAPNTGNGRFENGTLTVGADATAVTITPITGNGQNRLVFPAASIAGLSFHAVDNDNFWNGTMDGTITEVTKSGNSFVWSLNITAHNEDPIDWNDFIGGTLSVGGGGNMAITAVNAVGNEITTSSLEIPFTLRDDDSASLPQMPDLGMMAAQFALAYVLPITDGGGNPAFNRQNVAPSLNVAFSNAALSTEFAKTGAFESSIWRRVDYWVVYILAGYQGPSTEDGDPDGEAMIWGLTTGTPSADGGSMIFVEAAADRQRAYGWTAAEATEMMRRVVVHEIGHQFFIPDNDPTLGPGGNLYWYTDVLDLANPVSFLPWHLDRIRSTASPGLAQ